MEWQRQILNLLIDKRERSKAYQGEAKVRRRVTVLPREVFPDYDSARISVEEIQRFETEVRMLEQLGAVKTEWPGCPDHTLKAIYAREEAWDLIYQLADRRELREETAEQLDFYQHAGKETAARGFCAEECRRLEAGKKPRYALARARTLAELLDAIEENDQPLLERELSIRFFGDSKTFEKCYRKTVTDLLLACSGRSYPLETLENPDNAREKQILILSEYGIEPNPSYLYLKGRGELIWEDGRKVPIYPDLPTAFLAADLGRLRQIRLESDFVMTVENLTAYNRLSLPKGTLLFLSGYHTTGMEKLLRRIGAEHPELTYYHFGDLDPSGLEIFERLREKTGLPFQPWHMGVADLERFRDYGKPLEKYDQEKMKRLSRNPRWAEVTDWMVLNQLKLEQEIVAWFLRNGEEL